LGEVSEILNALPDPTDSAKVQIIFDSLAKIKKGIQEENRA
jgi:hypothetical protein